MIIRVISAVMILGIGFMLYSHINPLWASIPVAVVGVACAISALLPLRYLHISQYLVKIFAIGIFSFGIYMFYQRYMFMQINNGMEGPNGYGSPLAFLIGLVFEQLFFTLPGIFLAWSFSKKKVKKWQNAG